MAKWHDALIVVGLLALVGCQQQKPVAMVEPLPPPNFGGPTLASPVLAAPEPPPSPKVEPAAKAAPRPVTVAQAPAPVVPLPSHAGVPREWVPVAAPNRWKWIVIHHSATPIGGAARFGREHRAKGWDELGYHFVIGNGTDTANGLVEVGSRWPKQKWGAHAQTPSEEFNNFGIGICLVGNFDQSRPTREQMESLSRLVAFLMKTYHISADHVIGHGDTKPTECPGKYMSIATVRRMSTQILAAAGDVPPAPTRTASAERSRELLTDRRK
jgi:hypothetical protein